MTTQPATDRPADLPTDVPHILTAPHRVPFSGAFFGWCSCGAEFVSDTADGVRTSGRPHREAERKRVEAQAALARGARRGA
jgi:hypothetical protein